MIKRYKIGIYQRVSTEEQAENPEGSIRNQEERLKEFVKLKNLANPFGEIVDSFTDAGISAKDMNRSALQRLLKRIEAKEINMILVTELSRFTRSIKDFSLLQEFLDKHQCKFLSIKDNFDTTTAAGELVMYMMVNLAQYERKMTSERISHSFLARAKRGLFNGGSVPLGFAIDQEKRGCLKIDENDAEIVRLIFKTFLEEGTLARAAKALNRSGIEMPKRQFGGRSRNIYFGFDFIHAVITNRCYIGVRRYKTREGAWEESKASWPAIIHEETFNRAQALLKKNKYTKRLHHANRYPFVLSGLCVCSHCGDRMSGKSAHGASTKVPYYQHQKLTKKMAVTGNVLEKCQPFRIQAKVIEPVVWEKVKEFAKSEPFMSQLLKHSETPRQIDVKPIEHFEKQLAKINEQMATLAERIATLPKGVDESVFYQQMIKLQAAKEEMALKAKENPKAFDFDSPAKAEDLASFRELMAGFLDAAESDLKLKEQMIKFVIHKVEILKDGINVHFYIGESHYKEVLARFDGIRDSEDPKNKRQVALPSFSDLLFSKKFVNPCSTRLTIGGRYKTRTCDLFHVKETRYQLRQATQ